jgi:endonuclease-3
MNPAQIQLFFETLQSQNPHPQTELIYRNPFELLVAVMLSAQATDKQVNKVTPVLFAKAPTPQAVLALGQTGLETYLQSLNFYRSKARHVLATCALLAHRYQGQVPGERAALESLPGVGRKTANVVLNVVFGQPTMAVDTHIFRVANRTGLAPGRTPREVEDRLIQVIPAVFSTHAHHWLVLHGRYVCKARNPLCGACAVRTVCQDWGFSRQPLLPP